MKYVIIGGVAGGATAAARIRRNDEQCELVLFEKGADISYANCGLPYHIGGVIKERDALLLQTPEKFGKLMKVDVRVCHEVVEIDKVNKYVHVVDSKGKKTKEHYDKLLIATGASPIIPPIPGVETEGVYTLRNLADMDKIKAALQATPKRSVTIIGGGFIGVELAENFKHLGLDVTLIEMGNQIMAPLDYSMAKYVEAHMQEKGVRIILENGVVAIAKSENALQLTLSDNSKVATDLVILAIGVRPNSKLAKEAGLLIGSRGGIEVDRNLKTSDDSIYAVGDVIAYPHPLTGQPWMNYLAGPANRQARLVADTMTGKQPATYEGAIGSGIAKVFDLTVAMTGLTAKALKAAKETYDSVVIHPNSHAGYYPGATLSTLKMIYHPESGALLGAQMVGFEGVDKRIDQLALLIKLKATIYDLTALEHTYAPPFSSAKDPIAIAGYVALNKIKGESVQYTWHDVVEGLPTDAQLIDVRTAEEYGLSKLEGAINIPLNELRTRLNEIDVERPVYLYCQVGMRGYLAERILRGNGYKKVFNLAGGYRHYLSATQKQQRVEVKMEPSISTAVNNKEFAPITVDACGLQCPGPILKMKNTMEQLVPGQLMEIAATDAGFVRDAKAWCSTTGNEFIDSKSESGRYSVRVMKSKKTQRDDQMEVPAGAKGKTFIVFSDDLDKVLASFVLANGAAATGEKVTMFFTFWGLNVLKKTTKPVVKKDIFGTMFSWMLPSSSKSLPLSKMNMGGLGSKMMRMVMKKKQVASIETLRQQALEQGVEFIACQMSMDVMGVHREELLDEVTIGGVATYFERANQSNYNLFV